MPKNLIKSVISSWHRQVLMFGMMPLALSFSGITKSFSLHIQNYYYYLLCTRNELTKIIIISWCTKCKHTAFKIDEVAWHLSRLKNYFFSFSLVSTFHLNGKNKCHVISVKHIHTKSIVLCEKSGSIFHIFFFFSSLQK